MKHWKKGLMVVYVTGAIITWGNASHYFRPVIESRPEQGSMKVLLYTLLWPLYVSVRLQEPVPTPDPENAGLKIVFPSVLDLRGAGLEAKKIQPIGKSSMG